MLTKILDVITKYRVTYGEPPECIVLTASEIIELVDDDKDHINKFYKQVQSVKSVNGYLQTGTVNGVPICIKEA